MTLTAEERHARFVAGGQARAAQDSARAARVRGGQRRAAQPTFAAHNAAIAPRGFAATAARYGRDFALTFVAAWQLAHPPASEEWLASTLETWGFRALESYWRQKKIRAGGRTCVVDCIVEVAPERYLAVQPGAARWHDGDRDAAWDAALWAAWGIPTCRLDSRVIERRPQEAARTLYVELLRAGANAAELPVAYDAEEDAACA